MSCPRKVHIKKKKWPLHPRRCLLERSFGRLFLHLKEAIASEKKKKKEAIALERFSVVGVLYSFLHACFKCIMSIGKSLRWVFTFSHTLQQTLRLGRVRLFMWLGLLPLLLLTLISYLLLE